jgi:hypothetical protein
VAKKKYKQRSTKHSHKTKDRVTQTSLKLEEIRTKYKYNVLVLHPVYLPKHYITPSPSFFSLRSVSHIRNTTIENVILYNVVEDFVTQYGYSIFVCESLLRTRSIK